MLTFALLISFLFAGYVQALQILKSSEGSHTSAVTSATFTPDGKRIVTTSMDQTIRIWDAESGEELQHFRPIVRSSSQKYLHIFLRIWSCKIFCVFVLYAV